MTQTLKAPALRSPALAFEAREFAAAMTSTDRTISSIPVFTLTSSINYSKAFMNGENISDSKVQTSSLPSKLLSAVADLQFGKESYNIRLSAQHWKRNLVVTTLRAVR